MLRIVKPKTKRIKRILEKRAPKLDENVKKVMILNGTKTSSVIKGVVADLHHLKKTGGNSIKFSRKNDNVRPFEGGGETSLEFLSQKTDCSLFVFGSHSKKRPDNLVIGRMFDHHVYDMIELGVEKFKSIDSLGGGRKSAPQEGSKPCFAFIGEAFETKPEFQHLKELLLDFFRVKCGRGRQRFRRNRKYEVVETLNVDGLDRVFVCAAAGDKVFLKHCGVEYKKSNGTGPCIHLVEVGPSLDLVIRRHREPSDDLKREATRAVAKRTKKKVKNVKGDSLAGKVGKIYMPEQEVGGMALAKMKGLKRERRERAAERSAGPVRDAADKPAKKGNRPSKKKPRFQPE